MTSVFLNCKPRLQRRQPQVIGALTAEMIDANNRNYVVNYPPPKGSGLAPIQSCERV